MSTVRRVLKTAVPPTIFFLVVIAGWYVVSLFVLAETSKFLLPPPHEVVSESIFVEKVRSDMLSALWVTAKVALIGLAVAIVIGSVLAVIMSRAKWLERSFYPWVILLQTVPILAIVPVIGFWFGFDLFARIVVVVIIALFPLIINPLHGLQNVDPGLHDLFTLSNAQGLTRLTKLQIPSALPDVFIGLQSAAGLAIVVVTLIACAGLAWVLVLTTDASPLDAYLATTPGGIYAVMGTSAATGGDVTFVAATQVLRLLIVLASAPFLAAVLRRRRPVPDMSEGDGAPGSDGGG